MKAILVLAGIAALFYLYDDGSTAPPQTAVGASPPQPLPVAGPQPAVPIGEPVPVGEPGYSPDPQLLHVPGGWFQSALNALAYSPVVLVHHTPPGVIQAGGGGGGGGGSTGLEPNYGPTPYNVF